jgi:hypothetical protein
MQVDIYLTSMNVVVRHIENTVDGVLNYLTNVKNMSTTRCHTQVFLKDGIWKDVKMDKLISKLQSRIAKRSKLISWHWTYWNTYKERGYMNKIVAQEYGEHQKLDKQLLQQLYFDRNFERSILEKGL